MENTVNIQAVADDYNNGMRLDALSEKYSLAPSTLSIRLKQHGVILRKCSERGNTFKFSVPEADIFSMYSNGKTIAEIADKIGCSKTPVQKLLSKHKLTRTISDIKRSYSVNENFFETIDTEAKAYFLGWMFSDGYNNQKRGNIALIIHQQDKHILESFKTAISSEHRIVLSDCFGGKTKDGRATPVARFTVYSQKLSADLAKHGCVQAKSKILKFPTTVPEDLTHHFLRGYFDGDGCICKHTQHEEAAYCWYLAGTAEFLHVVAELLSKIVGKGSNIHAQPGVHTLRFGGNGILTTIKNYLYKDATLFLTRKKNLFDSVPETIQRPQRKLGKYPFEQFEEKLLPDFYKKQKHSYIAEEKVLLSPESKSHPDIFISSFKYFNMSLKDQWLFRASVLRFYREYGFPHIVLPKDKLYDEFDRLAATGNKTNIVGSTIGWVFNPHYIDASGVDKISVKEAFSDDEIVMRVIHSRMVYCDSLTHANFRRGFRLLGNIKSVGNFRPAMAKYIYNTYCPKSGVTWDMSIGYGGRLTGALASHIGKYIGTDPLQLSVDGATALYTALKDKSNLAVELHTIGSELFKPTNVDLCFTSPPYFNCEIYSDDETQCYNKFKELDTWTTGYLKQTFQNCYDSLNTTGKMVINVDTVKEMPNLVQVVLDTAKDVGFVFVEEIAYELSCSPLTGKTQNKEPILVFSKL